ncbi:hypothetical protein [Streptomyces sp. NPDC058279]|uniref:hypothetical protein n=1 Tax=Streptomyces sp. NPDC058279 TaxID=3346418 RepID=UPI0036E3DA5B
MMALSCKTTVGDGRTNVDEQLRVYHSYLAKSQQTPELTAQFREQAAVLDKSMAEEMAGPGHKTLPAGAYLRTTVIGFKVIKKTDDEVSVWMLTRGAHKNNATAKEEITSTSTASAAQWIDGDWKLTREAGKRANADTEDQKAPDIAIPGDEAFNTIGWTAIRSAS